MNPHTFATFALAITVKASLLLICVASAAALVRGGRGALRHWLWMLGLLGLLALPIAAIWAPPLALAVLPAPHSTLVNLEAPSPVAVPAPIALPAVAAPHPAVAPTAAAPRGVSLPWLFLLWLAGLLLALARIGAGVVRS